jgi:catechol 2,3-dioxygenase-like lactoylglutathione lyase family enzyme
VGALRHLNLTVSDVERSMAFYGRWFGFDRVLARYPDGTIFVTNGDGFELALHDGPPASDRRWHFGFTFTSRDEVLELADRLADTGIELIDRHDTAEYAGFKCQDPDGYWIEAYYEPRQ